MKMNVISVTASTRMSYSVSCPTGFSLIEEPTVDVTLGLSPVTTWRVPVEQNNIVYKIAFLDGSVYIGITCRPFGERLSQHKSAPTTVGAKLRTGMEYTTIILGRCDTRNDAYELERRHIAEAKAADIKLLNANAGVKNPYKGLRGKTKLVKASITRKWTGVKYYSIERKEWK